MAASHAAPRRRDGTPARATPNAARRRGHPPRASLGTPPIPCNKKRQILGSTRRLLDCLRILDGRRGFPCSSAGTDPRIVVPTRTLLQSQHRLGQPPARTGAEADPGVMVLDVLPTSTPTACTINDDDYSRPSHVFRFST